MTPRESTKRVRKTEESIPVRPGEGLCEHSHTCAHCREDSKEYGAAGERILSWAKAIEILMDQVRAGGEDVPEICDAVDGLSFAIATIADHDIVSVTLAPDDREVPLSGRYQGPRIVVRAS